MKSSSLFPLLYSFLAGLLAVGGFAPFSFYLLPIAALVILFVQWSRVSRARSAAAMGFAFGMGLFGAGVSWVYVALHDYGDMPPIWAALATALFAAVSAVFPALAGYAQARFSAVAVWARMVLLIPAWWALAEWLRGWVLTGFPWLSLGYSQVPESPLAGYAPVMGVYGVSLLVALSAGLLAAVFLSTRILSPSRGGRGWGWVSLLAMLIVLWAGGAALRTVEWTQPQGEPFKVALLQGNIPQEFKFRPGALDDTLETYRALVERSDARLIVLPETALPVLQHELPTGYLTGLAEYARKQGGDILIGGFERERDQYFNSVFSLGASASQHYRKSHLVPFGEFIPLRPALGWFINDVLHIPMGDLTRGDAHQPPLEVAGQKVAVDICYEDVFGEEIIRALPAATVLVNVTNDAWYGHSFAAVQHNQISQMRALETERMMLRATNTGMTSVIGRDGRIQQSLPQHEAGVLTAEAQGYTGSTPYVRWGNAAALLLAAGMMVAAWRQRR